LAGIFIGSDWTNRSWIIKAFSLLIITEFALYDKRHRISCGGLYIGIPCSHGYVQRPKEMDCRILADAAGLAVIKLALATDNLSLLNMLDIAELWGQSISMPDAVPTELHTGFIFFYLVQEFGLLLGASTIAIGCAITLVLVRVARQIKDQYGRMVVAGLTAYFTVNFYWHVLMSLGLAPFASVNLPFVSFGGSHTIAATRAILSIYKRKNLLNPTR
jgi:hypothetical protein